MLISIIIPALDEEKLLPRLLSRLAAELRQPGNAAEVIVVDGGSSDGTRRAVLDAQMAQLIDGERGRARQMNAGVQAAKGEVLWFVHADCLPPAGALNQLKEALADPCVIAGAFRTWHAADDARWAPWLHLADLRSRYTGLPYGDQALFVRRAAFERVGGFPDQPLMEDLELCRRLRRCGRIAALRSSVRVSGRRFLHAPVRSALMVNLFPLLYALGVSPRRLAAIYRSVR